MKKRIIIIGSTGIISSNLQRRLKKNKLNFISVGRKKINLKGKMSYRFLNKIIKSKDIIVFIAAEAPVKNTKMFINNMKICNNNVFFKFLFIFIYCSSCFCFCFFIFIYFSIGACFF